MGVKVLSRKYKNQFHSTSEETDWLLGNVGDWQRLELEVEAKVEFFASTSETVSIDSTANTFKLNNGKKWSDYGFDIGDEVTLKWTITDDLDNNGTWLVYPQTFVFTIQNMYNDIIESQQDFDYGQWTIFPTDRGNIIIKDVRFSVEKEMEGLRFGYSHITNSNFQSPNLKSFIDQTKTEFTFAGLNNAPVGVPQLMNPENFQSGMAIKQVYVEKIDAGGNSFNAEYVLQPNGEQVLQAFYTDFTFGSDPRNCRSAISIPLNKISGSTPPFKSQTGNQIQTQTTSSGSGGNYLTINDDKCFITQAGANSRTISIDFKYKIRQHTSNNAQSTLCLVLLRYNSSGNFQERKIIKQWTDVASLGTNPLSYVGTANITTQSNDKLSLALEFFHPVSQGVGNRRVWLEVLQANIKHVNPNVTPTSFNYKITCDFMIASFMEDISTFQNMEIPQILFDAGSLTDNFDLWFYPEWNNPNTIIRNDLKQTERLGNTGWFNENFNGLDNNFQIDQVIYKDLAGNTISQLDYAVPVILEAKISGVQNLNSLNEFTLGFAWVPLNEQDYKQKQTPFHENLLVNTCRDFVEGSINLNENTGTTIHQGYGVSGERMDIVAFENVMFEQIDNDTFIVKAKFVPNAQFTLLFDQKEEADRNYIIWVSAGTSGLDINFSDRVSLLLDFNRMVKTIPPAGPLPSMKNVFVEHPQHEEVIGVDYYKGHIEDDVLSRVNFKIDKTKTKIEQINFGYQVENLNTSLVYELEKISNNCNTFPQDGNGIQQININSSRNFKLVSGNNKNWVKIQRNNASDIGNDIAYKCFFATKIRWEDWIEKSGVPSEFFDTNLPNNGFHNNWLDYLRNGNHKVSFFVEIIAEEEGELVRYKNPFDLDFNGYDENLNIETTHKYFRHSDNAPLNQGIDIETGKPLGVILSNEKTRIEITYTNLTENFNFDKLYCVTSLEVFKGAGEMEYRQLSSEWLSEGDNPLQPLSGEDNLKIELLAPNIVKATCLIEPSLLQQVEKYKITGRIGCFPEKENNQPPFGLYEEIYETTYE